MEIINIEILGWVAAGVVIFSFLFKELPLRILNSIGALLWLYYGYVIGSDSILYLNTTLIIINTIKIHYILKDKNKINNL